jgi:hypothetical protein
MELLRSAAPDSSGRRSADPIPSSCGRQLSSQDGRDARSGRASQQPAGTGRDHVAAEEQHQPAALSGERAARRHRRRAGQQVASCRQSA